MDSKGVSDQELSSSAVDPEAFGAAQLRLMLEVNRGHSPALTAFDCLELWGSYPNQPEPLYAASLLFLEADRPHLALLVVEFAMTLRAASSDVCWPLRCEAAGWQMELLYARLLVTVGRVPEAMPHFGAVLLDCDDAIRREVAAEIAVAAQRLPLCELSAG